jgi:hypothetical protein
MGALAAVERFLERLFEGQSARLFHTRLRPIQVQRRLERAMESSRVRDGSRTLVPHRLVVRLAPDDLTALRTSSPGLAATLADGALAFARGHGYTLLDRPTVTLRADSRIQSGGIQVDIAAGPGAAAPAGTRSGAAPSAADLGDAPERGDGATAGAPPARDEPSSDTAGWTVPQPTAVFAIPDADGPRATVREIGPDGDRVIDLDGRALTIGRAPDNGLVLRDGRASRHHARIDARRGSLVLTDLGSTNGSWVNDRRIESVALGEGDRVRIGTTILVIESLDDRARDAAPRRPAPTAAEHAFAEGPPSDDAPAPR